MTKLLTIFVMLAALSAYGAQPIVQGQFVTTTNQFNTATQALWRAKAAATNAAIYGATLIPFTNRTRLVFEGDSITALGFSYVAWLTNNYLTNAVFVLGTNAAQSAETATNMVLTYTNQLQPFKPSGGTGAVLFVWAGINDLAAGAPATLVFAALSNIWSYAEADGFSVCAFTVTSYTSLNEVQENERLNLNRMIRTSPQWDYLLDADNIFPYADTTFSSDGLHPTTNSSRIVARQMVGVLSGYFDYKSSVLVPLDLKTNGSHSFEPGYNNTGPSQTAYGLFSGANNTGTNQSAFGHSAGLGNSGYGQTAVGVSSGHSNTGADQTAIGNLAGFNNTGAGQAALGFQAGYLNSGVGQAASGYYSGSGNSGAAQAAHGYYSGYNNIGHYQTAQGFFAGYGNRGAGQTVVGAYAGYDNKAAYQTAFGHQAAYYATNATRSVFLGPDVGPAAFTNGAANELWIHNDSGSPLIHGFFSTRIVDINGSLNVATNLTANKMGIGPTPATITNAIAGSASLDFPSTVAGSSSDLAITVTGVTSNNCHVSLSVPWQAASGGGMFTHYSSNDTVFVRFSNNQLTLAIDPTPATFSALVFRVQ